MKNRVFTCLLALLLLAGLGLFLLPQRETSAAEKRDLMTNEDLSLNSTFVMDAEKVMKDQFYGRDIITKAYYQLKTLLNRPFSSKGSEGGLSGITYTILNENVIEISDGYLINSVPLFDDAKAYLTTSRGYNVQEFVQHYPDIKTYVYFPTRLEEILDVGDGLNYGPQYRSSFIAQLGDKVTWDELKIENVEDYQECFYKSDFHWNGRGAYRGYSDIIRMIQKDFAIEDPRPVEQEIVYTDYGFHGNIASQVGSLGEEDHIIDLKLKGIGDYDYTVNGVPADLNTTKEDYALNGNNTPYSDFDYYFGDNAFERIFDFHQEDRPNLLIFADSFTNVTQEWIASHFNKTVIIDLRARGEDFDLDAYIRNYDIDILLVTQYYNNLFFNGNMYIPFN